MATRCIARSCLQLANPTSTSTARAFLQISSPRKLHTTSTPPLEFLLPSIPTFSKSLKRDFSTSQRRRQTTAIVNPRKDDDGVQMQVEITSRASNRLKQIMTKDSNPDLALRITVESGGCHGFQYLMSLTTLPPLPIPGLESSSNTTSTDSISQATPPTSSNTETKTPTLDEDDTVFAADDGSGAKIVMDGPSLELLKGSKVDFTMELIGSQFKIVDNPLATSSCGCGTSFDIKG